MTTELREKIHAHLNVLDLEQVLRTVYIYHLFSKRMPLQMVHGIHHL